MNVKFKGDIACLCGKSINIGDDAPIVVLKSNDLSDFTIGGKKDKFQIINVVPSLDTGVCATQARTFNKKASELKDAEVYVVSIDLPFAQGRFCTTEGIANLKVLSDFKNKEFGKAYGVLIEDSALAGLLTRAVFIVDKNGKLIYKEICDEITNEPNYEAALKVLE